MKLEIFPFFSCWKATAMVARKPAFAHAGQKIFVQTDRHKEPAQAERSKA